MVLYYSLCLLLIIIIIIAMGIVVNIQTDMPTRVVCVGTLNYCLNLSLCCHLFACPGRVFPFFSLKVFGTLFEFYSCSLVSRA